MGQIEGGDDRQQMAEVVVDGGYGLTELAQNDLFFGFFLAQQLAQAVTQFDDGLGLDVEGGPAGRGVVDNARHGVFLGGFDRQHKAIAPLGNQQLLYGPTLALQNTL